MGSRPTQAEVALLQLKNCLINLPQFLVTVLTNAQTTVQNVIVEIQFKKASSSTPPSGDANTSRHHSVYVGWTGMQSQRRLPTIGIGNGRNAAGNRAEIAMVEIDATFARMLGLMEGQRVELLLHLDPPLAHTVNIEPLTPADWEIIELHANFLEINLLSQIRALPNPLFINPKSLPTTHPHPLTLHLSPTSTANIIVNSLSPPISSSVPFAKISPDAEVIVAPKTRSRLAYNDGTTNRSVTSTSRSRVGGKNTRETSARQSQRKQSAREAVFLRAVDRRFCCEWFDDDDSLSQDVGLKAWVDPDVLMSKPLKGAEWVRISVVQPAGLVSPMDQQQQQKTKDPEASGVGRPTTRVVVKVASWDDAPDPRHVSLSSALSSALMCSGIVGGLIRIEAAPTQSSSGSVKALKVFPFKSAEFKENEGLRFGGDSKFNQEAVAEKMRKYYSSKGHNLTKIFDGPLTDGLVLSNSPGGEMRELEGILVRFDPPLKNGNVENGVFRWFLGESTGIGIEVQQDITSPLQSVGVLSIQAEFALNEISSMIGISKLIDDLFSHLSHSSSVLLTGGLGSGKTSLANLLAHRLRSACFFHTTFFSCRKLMTDETRISTIKETLDRIFMVASWGTRLGGRAVVILDDLDKLCPVETELQVGGNNERSRQISELICSTAHQYCGALSGIVLLATAQSKEGINSAIIGGHVVREIISLKAPDKDGRRNILQGIVLKNRNENGGSKRPTNGNMAAENNDDEAAWTADSNSNSLSGSSLGTARFQVDADLDFRDIAGQTDGYMPGDLVLLISRARSEALIRSIENMTESSTETQIQIGKEDFQRALKGFTPASLRNVTLQSSTVTFDSIGGLHETRKILLETLQYPTKYAPIFAQCPLRLRSGLLLYGYPGCGKTLLAGAVAGECGLNFISVKGPEILNKYIGASEKSVRDLFERAEAARPCVLFFDEFDSIAPKRGHDSTGVTDRVVNQLLTQMDGAEGLSGVYVLAATSRPDLIDPALLRPGRLDKSLICDLPNLDDRIDILQALSKKLHMSQDILNGSDPRESLPEVARRTEGYSGADLQAVIYNAHLEAIHDFLDDKNPNGRTGQKKPSKDSKADPNKPPPRNEILSFRYGESAEPSRSDSNPPGILARQTQASILAKLDAIKSAQRREKHKSPPPQNEVPPTTDNPQIVTIQWPHIEASLATTRSSISADERRRLQRIYREFVMGRNGEMPSGQGPTEVGGRSSLM